MTDQTHFFLIWYHDQDEYCPGLDITKEWTDDIRKAHRFASLEDAQAYKDNNIRRVHRFASLEDAQAYKDNCTSISDDVDEAHIIQAYQIGGWIDRTYFDYGKKDKEFVIYNKARHTWFESIGLDTAILANAKRFKTKGEALDLTVFTMGNNPDFVIMEINE